MSIQFNLPVIIIALLIIKSKLNCHAVNLKGINEISVSAYRDKYDDSQYQQDLSPDRPSAFRFQRFQSPCTIKDALSLKNSASRKSPLKWYEGKDGRKGFVSCTRLGGDYVLAESEQVAVKCTIDEVLSAYLSGKLQKEWNSKEVLDCKFICKSLSEEKELNRHVNKKTRTARGVFGVSQVISPTQMKNSKFSFTRDKTKILSQGKYYEQDLILHSQRIIRSHTGIMRYSQIILIDKIGKDGYSVLVSLDPQSQNENMSATKKRPFESLYVYVNLKQNGDNVDIYAAGLMQVNRKVVPNLFIFDASGIAGSMAGKGTLWLAGLFDKRMSN